MNCLIQQYDRAMVVNNRGVQHRTMALLAEVVHELRQLWLDVVRAIQLDASDR